MKEEDLEKLVDTLVNLCFDINTTVFKGGDIPKGMGYLMVDEEMFNKIKRRIEKRNGKFLH